MDMELKVVRHDKMFSFVCDWWNPITGCVHNCSYCWARKKPKYASGFVPTFHPRALLRKFEPDTVVFAVSEGDIFSPGVKSDWIMQVLKTIRANPKTTFLSMTKNPFGYLEWEDNLPPNLIVGATIETDASLTCFSRAPSPWKRKNDFMALRYEPKLWCAEPVIDFTDVLFARMILDVMPKWFVVGYDNYDNRLPEPSKAKVEALCIDLEAHGIKVFKKTIRESWELS